MLQVGKELDVESRPKESKLQMSYELCLQLFHEKCIFTVVHKCVSVSEFLVCVGTFFWSPSGSQLIKSIL